MIGWTLIALAASYVLFLAWRLGAHRRVPLIIGQISLDEIAARASRKHGNRPLFTTDEQCGWEVPQLRSLYPDARSWSASRIDTTAGYVAAVLLAQCSLQRGERVAVFKANHLDMHILMAAIVRAGGIACPVNGKFAPDKLGPYLDNLGARVLIADVASLRRVLESGAQLGVVDQIILADRPAADDADIARIDLQLAMRPRECRTFWIEDLLATVPEPAAGSVRARDEVLFLVHSSGTTGFPKAVALRNGAQSHALRGWLSYVHLSPASDKGYLAVPNNHQAVILTFNGLMLLGLRAHWTGAYDRDGFDAARVMRELDSGGFTGFFGFPVTYTQMKEVSESVAPLRRMRFWATTADASHEAIVRRFVARGGAFRSIGIPIRGSVFLDAQGSSEVGTPSVLRYVTPFTRRFERRIGRAGSTPFGPRIRISNADGTATPEGSVGRLEVKGKTVFNSYWNDPELTAASFRDEWFFTGDVARLGPDGHFVQLDREVDVIHTATGDVYSLLIEEEVHRHPAVFDACVYGERQADGSQGASAWVAINDGQNVDSESLRAEINSRLAANNRLGRIELRSWDEFPMGITGKTLKRVLSQATEPVLPPERNRPPAWRDRLTPVSVGQS